MHTFVRGTTIPKAPRQPKAKQKPQPKLKPKQKARSKPKPKRHVWSVAEKAAIGKRMKAYWAKRRRAAKRQRR